MSGFELLGAVAATVEVTSAIKSLLDLAFEVRSLLEKGSDRLREQAKELNFLVFALRYIEDHTLLHKAEVHHHLQSLHSRVIAIRGVLDKHIKLLSIQNPLRRVFGAAAVSRAERKLQRSLEALEREKTSLILYISATSGETVHHLANTVSMSHPQQRHQSATDDHEPPARRTSRNRAETIEHSDSEETAVSTDDLSDPHAAFAHAHPNDGANGWASSLPVLSRESTAHPRQQFDNSNDSNSSGGVPLNPSQEHSRHASSRHGFCGYSIPLDRGTNWFAAPVTINRSPSAVAGMRYNSCTPQQTAPGSNCFTSTVDINDSEQATVGIAVGGTRAPSSPARTESPAADQSTSGIAPPPQGSHRSGPQAPRSAQPRRSRGRGRGPAGNGRRGQHS